jgi:peptidoglycan/xylan/chitin deacetylase (PgdA/CDA1 family)
MHRFSLLRVLMFGACCALGTVCRIAGAQSLAISFEDGFDPQDRAHAALWNSAVLNALAEAHVTTIFFPSGSRIENPDGLNLVRAWGEAGHTIGNYGYGTVSYGASKSGTAPRSQVVSDFKKTQALLSDLPGWTPRFRLADAGQNRAALDRNALSQWLQSNHYKSAAVSIDVRDGYYSSRYQAWHSAHPNDDATRFRNAYLAHLWNRANYYDQLSTQLLHRSVPHVLRLHTNAINAAYLSDVIQMFRENGWTIISPEKAYADRLYANVDPLSSGSASLLWSLARQKGVTGLRIPAEDDAYEKPLLDKVDFSH